MKDAFTGIDSSKHELKPATEYTTAELLVIALIETKKAVDKINVFAKVMGLPSCPMPQVLFGVTGTVAGYAYMKHPVVKGPAVAFNEGLMRANIKGFIERTIPHEVAHIGADKMYQKRCGHGPEWKFVMKNVLGCNEKRCHNYDVREGKEVMKAVREASRNK